MSAGSTSSALPHGLIPMLATAVDGLPHEDGGWAYEIKWDGARTLAFVEDGRVSLQSRTQRDVTAHYPELAALGQVGGPVLLDGEVVAYDPAGRPSFERLQQRMNALPRSQGAASTDVVVSYIAFDLLHHDDRSWLDVPYVDRRRRLEDLAAAHPAVSCPAYHMGDGPALLAETRRRNLEGLVAKRADSPYVPGRRTRQWLKVKNIRRQELVVGGWLSGAGNRAGRLGALLVGYHEDDRLRYAGRVGSGFDDTELERFGSLMARLARAGSPFEPPPPPPVHRGAHYVEPRLVVEVAFSEWTAGGTLRQPSYKGVRADIDPQEVVREISGPPTP